MLFVSLQLALKVSEWNKLISMLQKHNVQFVGMLGKTLGLGRAEPSWVNHWKRHGFFWILKCAMQKGKLKRHPWRRRKTAWPWKQRKLFPILLVRSSILFTALSSGRRRDLLDKLESVGMTASHVRRTTANVGLVQEAWKVNVYFDTNSEGSGDDTVDSLLVTAIHADRSEESAGT